MGFETIIISNKYSTNLSTIDASVIRIKSISVLEGGHNDLSDPIQVKTDLPNGRGFGFMITPIQFVDYNSPGLPTRTNKEINLIIEHCQFTQLKIVVDDGDEIKMEISFEILHSKDEYFITKLFNESLPLEYYIDVRSGIPKVNVATIEYYNNHESYRPILNNGDITRYGVKWKGLYVNNKYLLENPRLDFLDDFPNIIVQRSRSNRPRYRLMAALNEGFVCGSGLYYLTLRDHGNGLNFLKYILAILNSKVIDYWISYVNLGINFKHGISTIPIKNNPTSFSVSDSIANIVDYIHLLKSNMADKPINTYVPNDHIIQVFEEVIDAALFELYFEHDFRRMEISIVENIRRDFRSILNVSESEKLEIIHQAYQNLRQKDNPLRNNIKLMDIRMSPLLMPFKLST